MRLLEVPADTEAVFIVRQNRYLAEVEAHGRRVLAHVHDSGRLGELLYRGNRVLIRRASNPNRKTNWDVLAAWFDSYWVFVHSGYHRRLAEAIFANEHVSPFGVLHAIKPEVKVNTSRLDFLLSTSGGDVWVETKGCTLLDERSRALFPDAPTERGLRHVNELISIAKKGGRAAIVVLVFHARASCFAPNAERHPAFAEAFCKALNAGVAVYPIRITYDGTALRFDRRIPVCSDACKP